METIEIQNLKPDQSESEESLELYSHQMSADESRQKQIRTQALTYLRTNYLKVFKILIGFIFILILLLTLLSILLSFSRREDNGQNLKIKQLEEFSSFKNEMKIETTTSQVMPLKQAVKTVPSTKKANNTTKSMSEKGIPCKKIKCHDDPCKILDVEYRSVKVYVCCQCKPDTLHFIRYAKNINTDEVSLFFQPTNLDPSTMSEFDLRGLPLLRRIKGVWAVVKESDTVFLLRYTIIGFTDHDYDPDE